MSPPAGYLTGHLIRSQMLYLLNYERRRSGWCAALQASPVPSCRHPPAAGSIEASTAETVTYYWAQSSGKNSAPATLTFTGPGTDSEP